MHLTQVTTVTNTLVKRIDSDTGLKHVNQYCMLEEIGRGTFGKVKLCRDDSGRQYALKIVRKPMQKHHFGSARRIEYEAFRNEVEIMKTLNNENIVRLYEVIDDPDANKVYLVMEYMSGGAIKYVGEDGKPSLSLNEVREYMEELAAGLEYLHDNGIIHRDIKPENLMLTQDNRVKICDFGSAQCEDFPARRTMGSPAFFAPELCRDDDALVTPAVDIWAAGLTLFMFVFGQMPFDALSIAELQRQIVNNYVTFPWSVEPQLQDLILECLKKDPKERIDAREILSHPWIVTGNKRRNEISARGNWSLVIRSIFRLPGRFASTVFAISTEIIRWIFGWRRDDW